MDCNEFNVDEGAFWHSNMSLYYGYEQGDVVEVVHEPNKYWLATIEYSYRSLVLLKWLGDYGDFWIDTSLQNDPSTNPIRHLNDGKTHYTPKRIFRLGHHKQCISRGQFLLEQPGKVLEKPSMYNPANDPYANVQTIDDLLALDMAKVKNSLTSGASLLDKCEEEEENIVIAKTKIDYGQEDADELEAALQNLNDIDSEVGPKQQPAKVSQEIDISTEAISVEIVHSEGNPIKQDHQEPADSLDKSDQVKSNQDEGTSDKSADVLDAESQENDSSQVSMLSEVPPQQDLPSTHLENQLVAADGNDISPRSPEACGDSSMNPQSDHQPQEMQKSEESLPEICEYLQTSACKSQKYSGLGKYSQQEFEVKPKQIFDLGGVNHERVIVPGTILEVAHVIQDSSELKQSEFQVANWYAIVLKNTGGRLTLRWFLCDEPKFKQGRLEPKSIKSELIQESTTADQEQPVSSSSVTSSNNNDTTIDANGINKEAQTPDEATGATMIADDKLDADLLTFTMHFCNPCIQIFNEYATYKPIRALMLPSRISDFIKAQHGLEKVAEIQEKQIHLIQNKRRMDLDRDRPLIDHLIVTSRRKMPGFLTIAKAHEAPASKPKSILVACKNLTKVIRAKLVDIACDSSDDTFVVRTEPIEDTGEVVSFVYPYDTSCTILPVDWAAKNGDCLSFQISTNPTPDIEQRSSQAQESQPQEEKSQALEIDEAEQVGEQEPQPSSSQGESGTSSITLNTDYESEFKSQFKIMQQLEVVHPDSNTKICLGRIRKVVYPLLWIQISEFTYTLLPFNSTDIYPSGWCAANGHNLSNLLPLRKRARNSCDNKSNNNNGTKRVKISHEESQSINPHDRNQQQSPSYRDEYEIEELDLGSTSIRALHSDFLSDEDVIQIYFNHKCFTGPTLSKSKICSLPRYVGPGRFKLVMEEVMTKIISVAYVPPRVLNDLSSNGFKELLVARNLTNTSDMEFKAKYQKRVHRETVPVCLNPNDVLRYCECVCEHLKCCYNLFGPDSYDGDDCPGHCRALTKSNKFMKRAAYYREKAKNGEYTNDNTNNSGDVGGSSKSKSSSNNNSKTSRARYAGRDSSSSTTSSSLSRSEATVTNGNNHTNNNSRPSSTGINDAKENLAAVQEAIIEEQREISALQEDLNQRMNSDVRTGSSRKPASLTSRIPIEFNIVGMPEEWTVEEVAEHLKLNGLGRFNSQMIAEGVDGQALVLLDRAIIREQFHQAPKSKYSPEELGRLYKFVEYVKIRAESAGL